MDVLRDDEGELVFLYQLVEGSTKTSYACHVATLAGIPKEIVSRGNEVCWNYSWIQRFLFWRREVFASVECTWLSLFLVFPARFLNWWEQVVPSGEWIPPATKNCTKGNSSPSQLRLQLLKWKHLLSKSYEVQFFVALAFQKGIRVAGVRTLWTSFWRWTWKMTTCRDFFRLWFCLPASCSNSVPWCSWKFWCFPTADKITQKQGRCARNLFSMAWNILSLFQRKHLIIN